jgi:hypothetical protein
MLLVTYKKILTIKLISLSIWCLLFFLKTYNPIHTNSIQSPHIFILDLSHSMNIKDVVHDGGYLSRLETSKQVILQSIQTYEYIGIVWCDDTTCSYLVPPTNDIWFIKQQLTYIHTNTLASKPTQPSLPIENSTVTCISDGYASFPSSLDQVLQNKNNTTDIIAVWNTAPQVILDPENTLVYVDDIRQTHGRNDESLLAYKSSIHYITHYSPDIQSYIPSSKRTTSQESSTDIKILLSLLLILLWL